MDRRGLLRHHIDLATARVLEIGALASPLVAPDEGRVEYVDHLDTEGLRQEYRGHAGVDIDKLVPVTHVWNSGTFAEAVGATGTVDAIVSSHVFEHFPNPIQWLMDAYGILAPGGQIYMVVPDKRFTFDRERANTRAAEWIEWYLQKPSRPTVGQVYDYHSRVVHVPTGHGWNPAPGGGFARIYDSGTSLDQARRAADTDDHIDAHCSVFTPYSLIELFKEIDRLGLFPFDVVALYPTPANDLEFALVLRRSDVPPVTAITREVDRKLAREAGYTGEFGKGGFAEALAADPALQQRHAAARRKWIDEATRTRNRPPFPELDPALHDRQPDRDDPRLRQATTWFQRLLR
ncbi:methyltransferase domain-containing protein [Thalassobaculum sp. OXR-137]|uniref:methyltransferase domain-containing protein n=1 Tax=Thalassobaculum sp. OXR-137 TaxID=3100173 RepID=UPI002AC89B89|nr:methyltransferase domain-containing protein [Thalassobaculum sp. OXR-137]WPZ36987.1 methyltransferase domain-containing protein [Thalassobaculum sp. OXR-137]